MPALETPVTLEVKQIQQPHEWKTEPAAAGVTDGSPNPLRRLSSGDDVSEIKPGRLVGPPAEAALAPAAPAAPGEQVVSHGQSVLTSLTAAERSDGRALTPNGFNAPVTAPQTQVSGAVSVSASKLAGAPAEMDAHISDAQTTVNDSVPKIIMTAAQPGRSSPAAAVHNVVPRSSPVVCVNTAASAYGQTKAVVGSAPASQTGNPTAAVPPASKATRVATITQTPGKGTVIAVPRPSTPQLNGAPRTPQSASVQLPAHFQVPQGMVLIRSDSGQLMLVSQQALAQAQGIIPRANSAGRVPAAAATSQVTAVIRKSEVTPVIKVPPPLASALPVPPFKKMTVLKATGGAVSPAVGQSVRHAVPAGATVPTVTPVKAEGAKATLTTTISAETLENVKKCKNFLVTLIKLASSGTHSAEMAKNVKELVKNLLDGKTEAEEFTQRLYTELKSSPQPYLVPFLKKSLPAVRQLTPNSQLFIQECVQPRPPTAPQLGAKPAPAHSLKPTQTPSSSHLVIQQPRGVLVTQAGASGPAHISLPAQNRTLPKQFVTAIQPVSHASGTITNQSSAQGSKHIFVQQSVVQRNGFKDGPPASFRDEDDINDVTSMAGVNLSEESARILATNSELVGSVERSCRDEPFIPTAVLQKRLLETGRRLGITDVSTEAVCLLSHATQERLRGLLEKLTVVAQHRKTSYKDGGKHLQTSDTRTQLKFLEQLDRLEKQRKDEEEREILLRIAKSRSNREDPEQLRLKQKAKEMQQLELAQMQHRDANMTALAAIGPRKKRPLDALGCGSGNEVMAALGSSPALLKVSVQRVTRVSLKDLLFCMEQDPSLRHTLGLYQALLR